MRPIRTEEVQPLLLAMLKAFQQFAKAHAIPYYAAGGTLLGTVRHHGFIPWDDDIDLFVTPETAKRLLEATKDDPLIDAEKRYRILQPGCKPNAYPTIKLVDTKTVVYERNVSGKYACGLWVDIFKMTYWADDREQAEAQFAEQNRLKRWLQLSIFGNLKDTKYKRIAPIAYLAKGALAAVGRDSEYWGKQMYALGSDQKTGFIGNLAWAASMKDRYPVEWYRETEEMPFEDTTIPVPKAYDRILTQFYGDYMQLPPEDQRIRHEFEGYYLD